MHLSDLPVKMEVVPLPLPTDKIPIGNWSLLFKLPGFQNPSGKSNLVGQMILERIMDDENITIIGFDTEGIERLELV